MIPKKLLNFFGFDLLQLFGFEWRSIAAYDRPNLVDKAASLDFLIEAARRHLIESPDRGTSNS